MHRQSHQNKPQLTLYAPLCKLKCPTLWITTDCCAASADCFAASAASRIFISRSKTGVACSNTSETIELWLFPVSSEMRLSCSAVTGSSVIVMRGLVVLMRCIVTAQVMHHKLFDAVSQGAKLAAFEWFAECLASITMLCQSCGKHCASWDWPCLFKR